jgi:hypothetical protein
VTFDFGVTAPDITGVVNFQWGILQELVQWFVDYTPNIGEVVPQSGILKGNSIGPQRAGVGSIVSRRP